MNRVLFYLILIINIWPNTGWSRFTRYFGMRLSTSLGVNSDFSTAETQGNYSNKFGGVADAQGKISPATNTDRSLGMISVFRGGIFFKRDREFSIGVNLATDITASPSYFTSAYYNFPNPNGRLDVLKKYMVETKMIMTNHHAYEIEPCWKLTKRFFGFMRFGYHKLSAQFKNKSKYDESSLAAGGYATNPTTTQQFRGISIGFGGNYFLTPTLFASMYGQWLKYFSQTVKTSSYTNIADEITLTSKQTIAPSDARVEFGLGIQFN